MIEVHVQTEGAFPNITGRRALLHRLPELALQPADDRQRNNGRDDRADQQRAAAHLIQQRQNQRRNAEHTGEHAAAPQQGFCLVGGHIAGELARLAVDGEGIGLALLHGGHQPHGQQRGRRPSAFRLNALAALADLVVARHRVAQGLLHAALHALHGALFAGVALRVRVIRHRADQNGALEGNRGAQVVGLQRFGDFVVELHAAVHGDVFKAHLSPAAHQIMPRAGNLPLALLLRGRRLRVVDDIGARVAVKQPVGHIQPTHFRNAVPAVQEDVRQQPLALEIIFKLLLRLLLRHDERNHLFRLHAALEAVGQDGRAAAVGALGGGGGILGHQLRAAVLAVIDLHAFLARLKSFLRPLEHDLFAALRRVQHFQRFRLKAVPAGDTFQLAAFAAEGQRPAAAGAVVTGCTHTCILLSCCTCCNRGYFPVSAYTLWQRSAH